METLTFDEAQKRHPDAYLETVVDDSGEKAQLLARVWPDKQAYERGDYSAVTATYQLQKECMYQNPEIPG